MGVGQIWRQRNRTIEARQRLIKRARLRQRHAEQKMRARASGIDRERLARMRDPVGEASRLTGGDRQPVKLIGLRQAIHAGLLLLRRRDYKIRYGTPIEDLAGFDRIDTKTRRGLA